MIRNPIFTNIYESMVIMSASKVSRFMARAFSR